MLEKQKLIFQEMSKRGIKIEQLPDTNLYLANFGNHQEIIIGSYTSATTYSNGLLISNKNFVRQILKDNYIPVGKGGLFSPEEKEKAPLFAKKIRFPVILRQANAQLLIKAVTDIKNSQEFKKAWEKLSIIGEGILVEEFFKGKSFRVFVTKDGFLNIIRKNSSLLVSRDQVNETTFYENITDRLYSSIKKLAKRVINSFPGNLYIAFEFLSKNIQNPLTKDNYIVSEVYPSPGANLYFPMVKNNIKKMAVCVLVDLLFPETINP